MQLRRLKLRATVLSGHFLLGATVLRRIFRFDSYLTTPALCHSALVRPSVYFTSAMKRKSTIMYPSKNHRILKFESLETRRMLDGNVTAVQTGSTLTITGNTLDNAIVLTNTSPNTIGISGLDTSSTGGPLHTKINNATAQALFNGITNIVVNFGATGTNSGNDAVVITNLNLHGGISISTGDGNIFVGVGDFDNTGNHVDAAVNSLLGPVSVLLGLNVSMGGGTNLVMTNHAEFHSAASKCLTINAGGGASTFSFKNTVVFHTAAFTDTGSVDMTFDNFTANTLTDSNTGLGNDSFTFTNGSKVNSATTMNTGVGNDTVNFDGFTGGSVYLTLGDGNNQVTSSGSTQITNVTKIIGGQDADNVNLTDWTTGWLNINLGSNANILSLTNVQVANTATLVAGWGTAANTITVDHLTASTLDVHTGAGADIVSLTDVTLTHGATINTEAGDDQLTLNGFSSDFLQVILLTGNDSIAVGNTTIAHKAVIGGGLGTDTYVDNSGNTFNPLNKVNFELPAVV